MATIGRLIVREDGLEASLQDSASNLLLVISFARALLAKQANATAKVTRPRPDVAQVDFTEADEPAHLTLRFDDYSDPQLDFYHFHWSKPGARKPETLQDGLHLGKEDVFWYGGANLMEQQFPLDKNYEYEMGEYVLCDIYQNNHASGQERYWLSSNRVALFVPWDVPLWTAVRRLSDGPHLLLQSRLAGSQYLTRNDHLEYMIAVAKEGKMPLKEFHQKCFDKFGLKTPTAAPDRYIIEKPIWSTWANFWTEVDQQGVEDYALELKKHGMPISQLELDDKWTTSYGDYEIDTKKFPNFTAMVQKLETENGARLTAWVHPFVNADSDNGRNEALREKVFMRSKDGQMPLSWWWDCAKTPSGEDDRSNKCAYVLDMTNPNARDWFRQQLRRMQQAGIYTFKFDAGETNWFPADYTLKNGRDPNDFGVAYAHFAAEFGPAVENRFGSRSQEANIFMRTMDRNSYWDQSEGPGGLSTLIPWALQSSLHGYFWNLPDMIGGNGLDHNATRDIRGRPPEEELYIRWTQANAFLLALQFSYPPWHQVFDQGTFAVVDNVKKALAIRESWMPYILRQVDQAVRTREPVIRPMWWASDHPAALGCTDQYMVGWKLVVAPVLARGKRRRDVFLPEGNWRDGNRDQSPLVKGNTLLRDYDAPLDTLPFFYRVDKAEENSAPRLGASLLAVLAVPLIALWA